jgi:glutathione S-transferase
MDNQNSEIVKLVQFPAMFGLPNASPYCMKVETFMRIAGIPYEIIEEVNPSKGPKGKLPYIIHKGKEIADSTFILEYLSAEFNVDLDSHLSIQEKAVAHSFQRLFEESLIWVMAYNRMTDNWHVIESAWFGFLPPVLKMFLPSMLKQQFKSKLMAQGIGRHSRNEIYHYGMKDLRAIVDQLGAKPFLMGDIVSLVDTTAYAFVSSLLINEFTSPIDELSKTAENLRAYRDRMQNLYFPELNYSRRDDLASV